jgi:hypothetical protein
MNKMQRTRSTSAKTKKTSHLALSIEQDNNASQTSSAQEIPSPVDETAQHSIDDTLTNKTLKRKVVSFNTMPLEKKVTDGTRSIELCVRWHLVLLVNDCLRVMQEGSDFLKVRSYARQFRRVYKLNENFTSISWFPTAKKQSKAISKSRVVFGYWIELDDTLQLLSIRSKKCAWERQVNDFVNVHINFPMNHSSRSSSQMEGTITFHWIWLPIVQMKRIFG